MKYTCMHGHVCMPTTTISLERSAYELLKSRKKPGESFSEELRRLLADSRPSVRSFLDLLSAESAAEVADAIETVRAEDLSTEHDRSRRRRGSRGRRS